MNADGKISFLRFDDSFIMFISIYCLLFSPFLSRKIPFLAEFVLLLCFGTITG